VIGQQERRKKTMSIIRNRIWVVPRKLRCSGFSWAIIAVIVAALCWAPMCLAETQEKDEAAGTDIEGLEITEAPLHMAAGDGALEKVKEFLEKGMDVNSRDVLGSTPLMFAALSGDLEICKVLVEHKADIQAQNNDGITALMYASVEGHMPVVEYLVEQGAEINVADNDGKSALSYAKADGRENVEKFLVAKGGKEPPALETMGWRHRGRCHRVPVCVRWRHGYCWRWAYEVRCERRHYRHHRPRHAPPPPPPFLPPWWR
jgi:hypothetical protein